MQPSPLEIAIAVVEWENQFLVGLRPDDISLSGYWEFPGGKVHSDELHAAAAVRECLEETGIKVEIVAEYPDIVYDYPHGRLHLRFFACRPDLGGSVTASRFRWIARRELASLSFPPANAALIRILAEG